MSTEEERLFFLLTRLTRRKERAAPKGVGLKTCLQARELGYVEIVGDLRKPTLRLTSTGFIVRRTAMDTQKEEKLIQLARMGASISLHAQNHSARYIETLALSLRAGAQLTIFVPDDDPCDLYLNLSQQSSMVTAIRA
jgi:hypothetical protein